MEDDMATYIISMNWTDQAMRAVKQAPERAQYGRELGKKYGVIYQALYLTTGDTDLVAIVDAANADNVAMFVLALCSRGNVRTRTCRAWLEPDYVTMVKELSLP
jgi:uncharacterized protein with GYD domain